ncbi:MAG: PilZ domain-containing protein [Sedimentisphaerales bacterium]|nr:PilZ domain-containing protein [Sedimentisphaerales bacterium]
MEKADERRTEHRLQYRWPVRFNINSENHFFNGQIVDVSSNGIAFLCHADQSCFDSEQEIKASFGVPHFGIDESFDTILFERTGHVRRIDKPSSQVYRIAMQFASPLFFKPGEQGINEIEAQQRLDAKNFSVIKSEETARAYNEALAKAQKQLTQYAQAKAKIEEQLKAEIEGRARYEAQIRIELEERIRPYDEDIARFEAKLQTREKELTEFAEIADKSQKRAKSLEEQLEILKEQTEQEINRIKKEASELVEQIKVKFKNNAPQSEKNALLKRFDKFISDRNKIF